MNRLWRHLSAEDQQRFQKNRDRFFAASFAVGVAGFVAFIVFKSIVVIALTFLAMWLIGAWHGRELDSVEAANVDAETIAESRYP